MIVVGVTGSLASGKSEVARFFQKQGAQLFDADQAAKKALQKGKPAYKAVLKIFGSAFLKKNKDIDRKKLAWHVFSHPADLKKLDILIHPGVIFECFKLIERTRRQNGVLALDVPLLFESRMENLADFTIVVSAQKKLLLERARRKGLPKTLAEKILSTQWPVGKKARLADYVIDNNGSLAELKKKSQEVYRKITAARL